MLVEEYKIGNTRIKIYDDAYVNKTPDEIEKIIKRIEKLGYKALVERANRENKQTDGSRPLDS